MAEFDLNDPCLGGVLPAAEAGAEYGGVAAQAVALYGLARGGAFSFAGMSGRDVADQVGTISDVLDAAGQFGDAMGPNTAAFGAYMACQIGDGLGSLVDAVSGGSDASTANDASDNSSSGSGSSSGSDNGG
jgi:hypothetical protein